jgi:MYXO-CTERM domain-containing protein
VCNGGVPAATEICDGKDNNCDTIIDNFSEACYPAATGCDVGTGVCKGVCRVGARLCTAGVWTACFGFQGPSPEVCNGLDDDCDGVVDDGVGTTCMDYSTCTTFGGCGTTCPSPPPEICDGKDNDCNGQTDDTYPEKGKICGKAVGECKPGTYNCVAGALVCQGETAGTAEICDGKDNDCNGAIDDNVTDGGKACWPGSYQLPPCTATSCPCPATATTCGECKQGATKFECQGGTGPTQEICDGKDNDCDGAIDEDAECPAGAKCIEGSCVLPCGGAEFTCPGGTTCINKWCMPDPCTKAKCLPTERCVYTPGSPATCVEKCASVTCGQYEKCEPTTGRCVDDTCVSKGCPEGQACVGYACVPDPCPKNLCPSTQFCADGKCYDLCLNVTCPKGETCSKGKCIKSPCAGFPCESNFICKVSATGVPNCEPDPCRIIPCSKGQVCWDGSCIKDPCATTRCPPDLECKLNTLGEPDCRQIAGKEFTTTQYVAAGGGGCSCEAAGAGGGGALGGIGLLLLLGLIRRRSR